MLPLVTCMSLGTEMPYQSSHTDRSMGTCSTPAAFTASQNTPSAHDALPMVPNAISLPLCENWVNWCSSLRLRYSLDAYASPRRRGICEPVGELSADDWYCSVRFFHLPWSSSMRVPKCAFMPRPPDAGSAEMSACA